jgi:hypothetical protein
MQATQSSVSMETLVAITAAVAVVLDRPIGSFTVKSIEQEAAVRETPPSVWAKAGILESHFGRGQFGLRTR